MIEIEYGTIKTKIYNIPEDILNLLESRLTFNYPNAKWIKRSLCNSAWDGKKKFYSKHLTKDRGICFTIKTGLLHKITEVLDELKNENSKYAINDCCERLVPGNRIAFHFPDLPILNGIIEYENHQVQAFNDMLYLRRGILCSPTGSGKTEIALSLSKYLMDNYLKECEMILFLTHRDVIFDTVWNERIELRFKNNFMLSEQDKMNVYRMGDKFLITAMAQTFISKIDSMKLICKNTRAVFCDEVHAKETYHRKVKDKKVNILDHLMNCDIRWGLSATPMKDTTGFTYHEKVQDFGSVIKVDYVNPVKVIVERKPVKLMRNRIYNEAVRNMEQSESRNAMIATMLLRNSDRKVLILTKHLEHGERLSKITGLPFMEGKTDSNDRRQIIDDVKSGKLRGFIASSVGYFGLDIPSLDMIIMASVGKSYINSVQIIGRGMRKFEGKKDLKVIDFTDEDNGFMQKHSEQRKLHYQQMDYEVVE